MPKYISSSVMSLIELQKNKRSGFSRFMHRLSRFGIAAYTGYEVGQHSEGEKIVVNPQFTVPKEYVEPTKPVSLNETVIILLVIVGTAILCTLAKYCVKRTIKSIKKEFGGKSNVTPRQVSYTTEHERPRF